MIKNLLVWAILDNKTGHDNQVKSVLEELNLKKKYISVQYNFLSNLPNNIIQFIDGFLHVKKPLPELSPPWPNLIISCGRRTFPLSIKLKNIIKPTPKLFHLMYPRYSLHIRQCDMIFTPKHDSFKKSKRIFEVLGSASNLYNKIEKKKYNSSNLEPIFLVLIGGNHGKYKFSGVYIEEIIEKVEKIIYHRGGSLLISSSRRTPKHIIKLIENIAEKKIFIKDTYHPFSKKPNPYINFLSQADEIIVTGDSISMISDACNIKKPVRIFFNKKICAAKHIKFSNYLIKNGYAFPFKSLGKKCGKIKRLETSKIISDKILGIINEKNKN